MDTVVLWDILFVHLNIKKAYLVDLSGTRVPSKGSMVSVSEVQHFINSHLRNTKCQYLTFLVTFQFSF